MAFDRQQFLQKSLIVDVQLGSQYAFEREKMTQNGLFL